ncbi:MAG: NAD(P)-dependent oxidoreductase [Flavobacteriales bacterium]|nr:NAD(P)-dependent oxidoreductase [Flavobacteriales bacterium]
MCKKILITGSNGLLGQKLVLALRDNHEVLATSIGACRMNNQSGFAYQNLDITNEQEVRKLVLDFQPDAIINTAAMTNVDACEDDQEECDKLNVYAVQYLADSCAEVGAHIVHISTDFIFDGEDGPYTEEDKANPLCYYGLSKWKSEQILQKHSCDWAVLRTIIVFGTADNLSRGNIVLWGRGALKKGDSLNIIDDQFRSPTLAEDLAQACILAVEKRAKGVYNASGKDFMSILEMVERMADFYGCDKSIINRISTATLNQKAKRPSKTGFILEKSIKELAYQPHSFEEGLAIVEHQILEQENHN